MELLDLNFDCLNRIFGMLTFKQQLLSVRPLCTRARDLTNAAVMANRLASALIPQTEVQPQNPMHRTVQTQLSTLRDAEACGVHLWRTAVIRGWESSKGKEGVLTSAKISCTGFEEPTHLAADVDMKFETFKKPADRRLRDEGVWEKDVVLLRFDATGAYVVRVRFDVIAGGVVHLNLRVTAKHDVAAMTVAFREGFAQRRASFVGKVLEEVVKDANASKATLLTRAFANCENAGNFGPENARVDDADPHIVKRFVPNEENSQGSFEEGGVRVLVRPRPRRENRQVDMSVL